MEVKKGTQKGGTATRKSKKLNPEAAEYYHRLVMTTDRFLKEVKRTRNLRIWVFVLGTMLILETLMLFTKLGNILLELSPLGK